MKDSLQMSYRGNFFASVRDITAIRAIKTPVSLTRLAAQPRPLYPNVVRTHFGSLDFLSYKGANLPPNKEAYVLATKTAKLIQKSSHLISSPLTIVDVGTGSGIIAITLAAALHKANAATDRVIVATDISGLALEVADRNAQINQVRDIKFRQRDILAGIKQEFGTVDFIIWNPPFYESNDIPTKVRRANFIPEIAINGGQDSLSYYRSLFSQVSEVISDQGVIIVQVRSWKAEEVETIAKSFLRGASSAEIKGTRGQVLGLVIGNIKIVEMVEALGLNTFQKAGILVVT